jgi:hypothetical protein
MRAIARSDPGTGEHEGSYASVDPQDAGGKLGGSASRSTIGHGKSPPRRAALASVRGASADYGDPSAKHATGRSGSSLSRWIKTLRRRFKAWSGTSGLFGIAGESRRREAGRASQGNSPVEDIVDHRRRFSSQQWGLWQSLVASKSKRCEAPPIAIAFCQSKPNQ